MCLTFASLFTGLTGLLVVGLLVNTLTIPAIGFGIRRWQPVNPRPWRIFQAAIALWFVGNLLRATGIPSLLRLADAVDACAYTCDIVAMWKMGVARAYRKDPTNLIDALIAVGGVAVLEWLFLVVPYLRNPDLGLLDKGTAAGFSLLSLTAFTFNIRLAIGPGARNAAFYLVAAASFCGIGAAIVTSIGLSGDGTDQSWQLPAAVLFSILAFSSISSATWHPCMRTLAAPANEPVPAMTSRRLAMMTLAVLIAPVVLVAETSGQQSWTVPVVVACWIFVTVLVMLRLAGLVRARSRATFYDRELAGAAEALLGASDVQVPSIAQEYAARLLGLTPTNAGGARFLLLDHEALELNTSIAASLEAGRVCIAGRGDLGHAVDLDHYLLAPLSVRRQLQGVLAVPIGPDTDDEAMQALGRLAREAALALERSELIAETERRAGERRFRALVEHSRDVVLQLDDSSRIRFATPAAQQVFGLADDEIVGRTLNSLVPDDQQDTLVRFLSAARESGARPAIELRVHHDVRGPVWCEMVATDLSSEPTVAGLVVTARAIDERKTAEQRLARSEARFRSLVQHSSDVVAVVDGDFVMSYASPSISRVLGHEHEDLIDREFLLFVHPDDRPALAQLAAELDPTGDVPSRIELRVRDGRDSWRTLDVTASDLRAYPAVQGIVLNAHDVSERKELELDLARQAMFDDLTGLANRVLFRQRLGEALEQSQRDGETGVAVLFLDLNEFKTINDSMGHAVGDDMLAIVAKRLAGLLRPTDTAARLGGDEFAMLIVSKDRNDALRVAQRVHKALADPISVGGREITVAGSIGVAYADDMSSTMGDLLRNADTAMYVAKRRGLTGQIEVFDSSMLASVTERLELMNDLGRVLERNELVLYYQPLIDLASGRVKGFEALTRWVHPTRGIVSPASFVPLAEEVGLILPITEWVLDTALRQQAAWNAARGGEAPLSMSVNLSGRHIEVDGAGDMVEAALHRYNIEPQLVTVELTESLAIDVDSPDVRRRLEAITDLGVQLAADDFGAGFASYANLQRLPYSVVKIDRSVIDGLENAHEERARLQIGSIIDMAHGAGMTVVAEGVEGAEQLRILRELGCDIGQGYYFARPVPAEQATAMLIDVASAA